MHTYTHTHTHTHIGFLLTKSTLIIARRNINNLRHADNNNLMAESEEELQGLLMKVKEDSGKAGLKFNINKLRSRPLVPSLYYRLYILGLQNHCSW